MELETAQLVLENEEFLLEGLNAELAQRVLLQTQAGLLLEVVGQQQRIERDITLSYIERSRVLDEILRKQREVELIDLQTGRSGGSAAGRRRRARGNHDHA